MNKVDFALIISVRNCNPNGDPINGNRPRQNLEGYGEISDVCLKRKIRNRLQYMGENILNISADRVSDGYYSVKARLAQDADVSDKIKKMNVPEIEKICCEKWMDVRAFGQVLDIVDIQDVELARSTNINTNSYTKDSSTFGTKYIVPKGVWSLRVIRFYYAAISNENRVYRGRCGKD